MKKILAFVLTLTLLTAVPASFASLDYNGETHTSYCSNCGGYTSHELCTGPNYYFDRKDGTHMTVTTVQDICTICNDRDEFTDLTTYDAHFYDADGYCVCGAYFG